MINTILGTCDKCGTESVECMEICALDTETDNMETFICLPCLNIEMRTEKTEVNPSLGIGIA